MDLHYCEIDVKYRRFGFTRTRKQGFLFSMLAWYLLYEEYGWDFDGMREKGEAELMSKMVYLAAKVANWDKGLPAMFTLADVAGWLDQCNGKDTKLVEQTFKRAMTVIPDEIKERGEKAQAGSKKK